MFCFNLICVMKKVLTEIPCKYHKTISLKNFFHLNFQSCAVKVEGGNLVENRGLIYLVNKVSLYITPYNRSFGSVFRMTGSRSDHNLLLILPVKNIQYLFLIFSENVKIYQKIRYFSYSKLWKSCIILACGGILDPDPSSLKNGSRL